MPEKRVTAEQRRIVTERAKNCCEYCLSQSMFATELFSVEHIIPRTLGGGTDLKNLALACQGCNAHKHVKIKGYDSLSRKEVPLYNPRTEKWERHFRWNDDFSLIIGLTPTGRATVDALNLNREGVINLRRVLYEAGKHPP